MKFERDYELRIKTPENELITITPPVSIYIDVTRNVLSSMNTAKLTLINLAPGTRNKIFKDKYNTTQYWQVILMAGYKTTGLFEIFRGNILIAYSYKQKSEWYTEINAFDGGYVIQNGFVSETVSKETGKKKLVERIINSLDYIAMGVVGEVFGTDENQIRGKIVIGSAWDTIQDLSDGKAFIDGETVNILNDDEILAGAVYVLNNKENLLTSPKRQETYLECDILFAPEVKIAHYCEIQSLDTRWDGQYKVLGIHHVVPITQVECGDAITSLSLDAGAKRFSEVS